MVQLSHNQTGARHLHVACEDRNNTFRLVLAYIKFLNAAQFIQNASYSDKNDQLTFVLLAHLLILQPKSYNNNSIH